MLHSLTYLHACIENFPCARHWGIELGTRHFKDDQDTACAFRVLPFHKEMDTEMLLLIAVKFIL